MSDCCNRETDEAPLRIATSPRASGRRARPERMETGICREFWPIEGLSAHLPGAENRPAGGPGAEGLSTSDFILLVFLTTVLVTNGWAFYNPSNTALAAGATVTDCAGTQSQSSTVEGLPGVCMIRELHSALPRSSQ